MEKIRVFHIIESLSWGGAERRLINDLKFIDKEKFENAVCVLFNDAILENEITNLGIRLYRLGLKRPIDFKGFCNLVKMIRIFKADIVHTQLFWADIYGRLAGRIAGVPKIVSTVQSSVYEPDNLYLFSRKRKWLDKITGQLFNNRYIAVSEFVKKSIVNRLGIREDKIGVIYNCIDLNSFKEFELEKMGLLKKELGLSNGDIILSTVGRLNPAKGHRFLLEALSILKPDMPSIKLCIIGDGPSRQELMDYAKGLNLEKEVLFLRVRNDVKELLKISDIFVFPTLSEGMPFSLLEAMAAKKPCIASRIDPIQEIIKDKETGYLFSPGNSRELALVIQEAFGSRQKMQEVAEKGFQVVREKYNAKKATKALEEFYEDMFIQKDKAST